MIPHPFSSTSIPTRSARSAIASRTPCTSRAPSSRARRRTSPCASAAAGAGGRRRSHGRHVRAAAARACAPARAAASPSCAARRPPSPSRRRLPPPPSSSPPRAPGPTRRRCRRRTPRASSAFWAWAWPRRLLEDGVVVVVLYNRGFFARGIAIAASRARLASLGGRTRGQIELTTRPTAMALRGGARRRLACRGRAEIRESLHARGRAEIRESLHARPRARALRAAATSALPAAALPSRDDGGGRFVPRTRRGSTARRCWTRRS